MAADMTYAEAVEQSRRLLAQARLTDPDDHFPYKHDVVCDLLAENPPMGPGLPDRLSGPQDRTRDATDYTSRGIANASRDYVEAQAAWLADPSNSTLADYEAARDRLVAARLDHRQNRDAGFTIGAAARKAG